MPLLDVLTFSKHSADCVTTARVVKRACLLLLFLLSIFRSGQLHRYGFWVHCSTNWAFTLKVWWDSNPVYLLLYPDWAIRSGTEKELNLRPTNWRKTTFGKAACLRCKAAQHYGAIQKLASGLWSFVSSTFWRVITITSKIFIYSI